MVSTSYKSVQIPKRISAVEEPKNVVEVKGNERIVLAMWCHHHMNHATVIEVRLCKSLEPIVLFSLRHLVKELKLLDSELSWSLVALQTRTQPHTLMQYCFEPCGRMSAGCMSLTEKLNYHDWCFYSNEEDNFRRQEAKYVSKYGILPLRAVDEETEKSFYVEGWHLDTKQLLFCVNLSKVIPEEGWYFEGITMGKHLGGSFKASVLRGEK